VRKHVLDLVRVAGVALVLISSHAFADGAPAGPHPRLFSDPATIAGLKRAAGRSDSAVAYAVRRCRAISASPSEFSRDGYMGLDWAQYLQACLVAWRATDDVQLARTALRYFTALIDDLQEVGDGRGGDRAAWRDSGFAIRAHGPYTALAYDWLQPAGLLDDSLKARARQRFKSWTDWYAREGYRHSSPGTNYHAGYVFAATLIAIAEAGEAGEDGKSLWRHVVDDIFGRQLLPSAATGVLLGGDWGEGWQYAPLSVAEYSVAARAVAEQGVDVSAMSPWLEQIMTRHVYALTPAGDETYAVGDTQAESANLPIRRETLAAVIAGPAPARAKAWAQAEIDRLKSVFGDPTFVLFDALADAQGVRAERYPRASSPTEYLARGTSVLYTRSSWQPAAVWFVLPCSRTIDVDHMHPNAGNFVLTRGDDHLIVDPSPYGTLSSLTSNAPTVRSMQLPANYIPSQAFWGEKTRFRWAQRLQGGEFVARCDYADQYRFQDRPSDVSFAQRDFVFLPFLEDGAESAALFIFDRANGRVAAQDLHVRFRSPEDLQGAPEAAVRSRIGRSSLHVLRLAQSGGAVESRALPGGSCFDESRNYTRGNCDAARFPVHEVRFTVPGPNAKLTTLVAALGAGQDAPVPVRVASKGGETWLLTRGSRRWVVSYADADGVLTYESSADPAQHIVLSAAAGGAATTNVDAVKTDAGCRIAVGGSGGVSLSGAPALFGSDGACVLKQSTTRDTLAAR
jgi:hypothetical protein